MQFVQVFRTKLETSGQLLGFFWSNKWWWVVPMLGLLLIFAVLIAVAESSAIAPFIYSLW